MYINYHMHMSLRYIIQTKHLLVVHKLTHTHVSDICDTEIKTKHLLDLHKSPHTHVPETCDSKMDLLDVHKLPHAHVYEIYDSNKAPVGCT